MPADRMRPRFNPPPMVREDSNEDSNEEDAVPTSPPSHVASAVLNESLLNNPEPRYSTYGLFTNLGEGSYWDSSSHFQVPSQYRARRNDLNSAQENVESSRASSHREGQLSSPRTSSTRRPHDPYRSTNPPRLWNGTIDYVRMMAAAELPNVEEVAQQRSVPRTMSELPNPAGIAQHRSMPRVMARRIFPIPVEVAREAERRITGAEENSQEEKGANTGDDTVDNIEKYRRERLESPESYSGTVFEGPLREHRITMPVDEHYDDLMWPDREIRGRRQREIRQRERELAMQNGSDLGSAPVNKKRRRSS